VLFVAKWLTNFRFEKLSEFEIKQNNLEGEN
jgi:hypothetical protein